MRKIIYSIALFIAILSFAFAKNEILRVGVTGVPSKEILELIKDDLEKDGIDLKIVEYTDYQTPNMSLVDGSIDANSYQHKPFLAAFNTQHKTNLISVGDTFTGIMALYSKKIKNIKELKAGDKIGIPNDATNEERALLLFEEVGLIKLNHKNGVNITTKDIVSNPKQIDFRELDAGTLPRALDDLTGCVINPGYATTSGLNPKKDGIYYENGTNSPYLNVIATRPELKDDKRIKAFLKAFKTGKVKDFLENRWGGQYIYAW
jgi:D-methionine transport system substrate-binding protein